MMGANRSIRRDGCCQRRAESSNLPVGDTKKILYELQLIDFSMIDTILDLDAYPCSAEALDYYHKLKAEREKLQAMLEQNGYPLTAGGNTSHSAWDWTNAPWPWELEAN